MQHKITLAVIAALAVSGAIGVASAGAAKATEVWTFVEHDVTLESETFPDDICGARAVTETVTNWMQFDHLTAHADGSFHFADFETGVLVADYHDPTIPDQTFRRTEMLHVNLTPGETVTVANTLRQFDSELTIRAHYQLVVLDGVPKIERSVTLARGCP